MQENDLLYFVTFFMFDLSRLLIVVIILQFNIAFSLVILNIRDFFLETYFFSLFVCLENVGKKKKTIIQILNWGIICQ